MGLELRLSYTRTTSQRHSGEPQPGACRLREYQSGCTNADFDAHRRQRAATAWKYAMWGAGCRMPTQAVDGRTHCFCGEPIDVKSSSDHIYACYMELV
jgi:hypothetical protein